MGEDSNKPKKGGGDDLLSKLFDLDSPAPDQNPFGEPTKIDNTFVVSKASHPTAANPPISPASPPPKIDEMTESLFDGILDEEPEKLSVVSPADLTDISFTNVGQTSVEPIEELIPELEVLPDLDSPTQSLSKDSVPPTKATKSTTSGGGARVNVADPIDEALAQFELPSAKKLKKTESQKIIPKLVGSEAFEIPSSVGGSVKANQFSAALSLSQSFVQVKNRKYAVLGTAIAVVLCVLGFAWNKLSTDSGLFGRRLDGFQLVKAYQAPSDSELLEFEKSFEISKEARISDDPQKLETAMALLKSVIARDSRNIMAAGLMMEHSARLILWHGLKSSWPTQYEDAQKILVSIKEMKNIMDVSLEEKRAKAARSLAVEDYGRVIAELKTPASGSTDENLLSLILEAHWKLGQKEAVTELISKLISKDSPRTKLIVAMANGDQDALRHLASAGYLPAAVEEIGSVKVSKESASDYLQKVEALREKVKQYPLMTARLDAMMADAFWVQGDADRARAKWNESLLILPRAGAIWTKLAMSFEDDAKWDEALAAYRSAEKANSLTEDGVLRYARLLRIRGKVVDALAQLDEVLKSNPKSAQAHVEKGLIYVAIYQEEQARGEFLKALESHPNDDSAILGLVQIAVNRREWMDAEMHLKKISAASPAYAESLLSLARISLEQNRFKEAEDFYLKAISKNPKLESAYVELAKHYLLDERDDKALELIGRALSALPKSPGLKVARARLFQFQGDLDKALADVETVQKSFDHLQDANITLVDILIDRKELSRAYEILGKFDAMLSKDLEVSYLKVKAFLKEPENPRGLGSAEAAGRVMEGVLRRKPDEVRFRLAAAQVALLLQDKNTAIEHVDSIMKARPNFAPALVIRADFYRDVGDYDNAIPLYEEALKFTRFKGEIYKKLASGYKSLGKSSLAIQYYQKVTQANPKDAQSHLELGKLYSDDGRYTAALSSLSRSVEINPEVPEAHYFLGFVHKELGNRKAAIKHFEKFMSMVPEGKEASTIKDEIYFLRSGSHLQ